MNQTERQFKALGDKTRLRILMMLQVRPLCGCEVSEILGLAPSTTSKHLSLLRQADLVEDRRAGKWVIYSLPSAPDPTVRSLLELLERQLSQDPQVAQDRELSTALEGTLTCQT